MRMKLSEPADYLRKARLSAGYESRTAAAMDIPYPESTIGLHERGQAYVKPTDAITYAKHYDCPGILLHYCATCPIGKETGKQAVYRDLPHATLRFTRRLRMCADESLEFEKLADEGISHREGLEFMFSRLDELSVSINDLKLSALTESKKKKEPLSHKRPLAAV